MQLAIESFFLGRLARFTLLFFLTPPSQCWFSTEICHSFLPMEHPIFQWGWGSQQFCLIVIIISLSFETAHCLIYLHVEQFTTLLWSVLKISWCQRISLVFWVYNIAGIYHIKFFFCFIKIPSTFFFRLSSWIRIFLMPTSTLETCWKKLEFLIGKCTINFVLLLLP